MKLFDATQDEDVLEYFENRIIMTPSMFQAMQEMNNPLFYILQELKEIRKKLGNPTLSILEKN